MTSAVVDAEYELAVTTVTTAIKKAKELTDVFVAAVNRAISALPVLRDVLMDAFNKLMAKIKEVLDFLWRLITERGNASAVRQVAERWSTAVGGGASEQAGLVNRGQLRIEAQWEGVAASAYLTTTLNQIDALKAVKTTTNELHDTLSGVADALRTFWVFVAAETVAWLTLMAICAVTNALGGLPAAIAGTAAYLGLVTKHQIDFANHLDTARDKLRQITASNDFFAAGNWPPVMTDAMSDASVTDGDRSDWKPAS